ncbi:MAG: hypothetical protein ACLPX5_11930 [Dissulfurispiraceae bacterium]
MVYSQTVKSDINARCFVEASEGGRKATGMRKMAELAQGSLGGPKGLRTGMPMPLIPSRQERDETESMDK